MSWTEKTTAVPRTKETLRKLGVEGVLYDLDDTLIYTSEIFRRKMEEYTDEVSRMTGIDREVFYRTLAEINDEEYKIMGVNPQRWGVVAEKLAEMYQDGSGVITGRVDILMGIYRTIPRMRPGVVATMTTVKEAGIKQGLVTHANVEWTAWKMDMLGLWRWFDAILVADENGHKREEHWSRAMEMLETDPSKCLVVGDSLKGDIVPAASLGARTVWMPSPWSVYREEIVPEGTVQMGEFSEFLEVLHGLS